MSSEALSAYNTQLQSIMGEGGHFTELAVFDPSGDLEQEIYGIYNEYSIRKQSDAGNANQKTYSGPSFVVKDEIDFDIYENKTILLRDITFTIQFLDRDKTGVQTLWLLRS